MAGLEFIANMNISPLTVKEPPVVICPFWFLREFSNRSA